MNPQRVSRTFLFASLIYPSSTSTITLSSPPPAKSPSAIPAPSSLSRPDLKTPPPSTPGTQFTAPDLSAAVPQRPVVTGYFNEVGALLDGTQSKPLTDVGTAKPTPRAGMLPVGFENFVWLTHAELEAAIHSRFPLFNDYLPENSPHQEDVKSALVAALAAKSIPAQVEGDEFQPTPRPSRPRDRLYRHQARAQSHQRQAHRRHPCPGPAHPEVRQRHCRHPLQRRPGRQDHRRPHPRSAARRRLRPGHPHRHRPHAHTRPQRKHRRRPRRHPQPRRPFPRCYTYLPRHARPQRGGLQRDRQAPPRRARQPRPAAQIA